MPRKGLPGWLQGQPPTLSSPQGKGSTPQPQVVKKVPPTAPGDSGNVGGGPAPTLGPASYRPFKGGPGRPRK
jgi:hypothetical protein